MENWHRRPRELDDLLGRCHRWDESRLMANNHVAASYVAKVTKPNFWNLKATMTLVRQGMEQMYPKCTLNADTRGTNGYPIYVVLMFLNFSRFWGTGPCFELQAILKQVYLADSKMTLNTTRTKVHHIESESEKIYAGISHKIYWFVSIKLTMT